MESIESPGTPIRPTVAIALLGLSGCALIILVNTFSVPTAGIRAVGTFGGLFLAFVGLAGVMDTVRSGM